MKTKSALSLLFLISVALSLIQAQPKLWGTMPFGGETESGTVFELNLQDNQMEIICDFMKYNCERPLKHVVLADNNKFYGIADGGFGNFGSVIYEYDPVSGDFRIVHDFFSTETYYAHNASKCALMQASDGLLYGFTQNGGTHGDGQLFSFNIESEEMVYLTEFEEVSKGKTPIGCLLEASDNRLYGVANEGGANGLGVLFVYDPSINMFAVLKHFSNTDGANPVAGVMQAADGLLYGMTTNGGQHGDGVLFYYKISTSSYTKALDFNETTLGSHPLGGLVQASDGNIYGFTSQGGNYNVGVFFRYDPTIHNFTMIHQCDGSKGEYPTGSLIDYNNCLYGMMSAGGSGTYGVIVKFDYSIPHFTKIFDFSNATKYGSYPYGSLTLGPEGTLFGQTSSGGVYPSSGVMFEFDPVNNEFEKKFDFKAAGEGSCPYASPVYASDGMVYGTNFVDGEGTSGTIYRINPVDHEVVTLYHFNSQNTGAGLRGGLTEASNGMMYGMAGGGLNADGILYLYNPLSNTVTVLHNFDEVATGYVTSTNGKLLELENKKLYGLTYQGGIYGDGVLFEYDMNTSTLTKLVDFDELVNGRNPVGTPVYASNGMIYGIITRGCQYDKGGIFRYDPVLDDIDIVTEFNGTNGEFPFGDLIEYDGHYLYGITQTGGANGDGLIFSYDIFTGTLSTRVEFEEGTTGFLSQSSLLLASDGLMYGSTQHGCANGFGGIFEYDPEANTISNIYAFTSFADRHQYGPFIEVESDFGIKEKDFEQFFLLYPNPVKDVLTIDFNYNLEELPEIHIVNMHGQEINDKLTFSFSNNKLHTDVSALENGTYFLQVITGEKVSAAKFVKID